MRFVMLQQIVTFILGFLRDLFVFVVFCGATGFM